MTRRTGCASSTATAVAPLAVTGDAPTGKRGTRVTFQFSGNTFKNVTEYDFDKLEHRYRELAFLNSGVRVLLRDKRHEAVVEHDLYYEGGIGAFVQYLDRNKQPLIPEPIAISAERDGIAIDVSPRMERQLLRECADVHQQHPAARRRHASCCVPRRADAHAQQLCRALGG